MFKLSKRESYKWPVKVEVPNNGAFTQQTFTAEFKFLPQSRIDAIVKNQEESEDLASEILLGWDGIVDDTGEPVPFSEETKTIVLDLSCARRAVVQAFFNSIAGRLPKT